MVGKGLRKAQKNIYFIAMNKFKQFKQLYQDNKFDLLLKEEGSVYWLKLRSISRKELLIEFCEVAKILLCNVKSTAIFEYVYSIKIDDKILDRFIAKKYLIERSARKMKE